MKIREALQEMADLSADAGMHPDRVNAVCDAFAGNHEPGGRQPVESMDQLIDALAQAAKDAGLEVPEHGYGGYDHGDFYNMDIRLPDGFEAHLDLKESEDDEYQIRRY